MNSEELELSLRSEFENYLKGVFAEMRQDVKDFQNKIDAEFEKHKSQMDDAFQGFTARFDSEHEFDKPFTATVVEHLRLSRDEGAKVAANAFAESEKLNADVPAPTNFAEIRDAISDISSKNTQSTILKSLVQQASKFAPRGAFFIVKSEHFTGWKVFGKEVEKDESAIRDIRFPVSSDSILGKAVSSISTVDSSYGTHADDTEFLDPLHFGQPDRMHAIPLVARGRGVAVLYADYGSEGVSFNLEALEAIVRVAGLTVELLASSQAAKVEDRQMGAADFEDAQHDPDAGDKTSPVESHFQDTVSEIPEEYPAVENKTSDFAFSDSSSFPGTIPSEPESIEPPAPEYTYDKAETFAEAPQLEEATVEEVEEVAEAPQLEEAAVEEVEEVTEAPQLEEAGVEEIEEVVEAPQMAEAAVEEVEDVVEAPQMEEPTSIDEAEPTYVKSVTDEVPVYDTAEIRAESSQEFEQTGGEIVYDSGGSVEPAAMEFSTLDEAPKPFEPEIAVVGGGIHHVVEPTVEVITPPIPQSRLSDRPVDLPIEVPDDERRIHNDARRFARLLVSEIKLYNEKKVLEGRAASDLYDRLREAIDRSREMYDKRVQPPVAAKFDYFHYELLNALAEGETERLGSSYPGATV